MSMLLGLGTSNKNSAGKAILKLESAFPQTYFFTIENPSLIFLSTGYYTCVEILTSTQPHLT